MRTHVPLLAAAAVLGLVAGTGWALRIDPALLTRDPASIAGLPPLAGVMSNLGVLGWWTSASVWAFAALLLETGASPDELRFARAGAALSAWLALDDLFQFHESLAPQWLGLPEKAVYAGLALAVAAYARRHRERLLYGAGAPLPLLAFGWLAASVLFDQMPQRWQDRFGAWEYVVEDGCKWFGIACWCGYALVAARSLLSPAQAPVDAREAAAPRVDPPPVQPLISGS